LPLYRIFTPTLGEFLHVLTMSFQGSQMATRLLRRRPRRCDFHLDAALLVSRGSNYELWPQRHLTRGASPLPRATFYAAAWSSSPSRSARLEALHLA